MEKYFTRAFLIGVSIDAHFPSNKGNWIAYDSNYNTVCISHKRPSRISPLLVAVHILRNFTDVQFVKCGSTIYTATTIQRAGFKI